MSDLNTALREIEKVLEKYDFGGFITICSKNELKHKFQIPKWSLLKLENHSDNERVKVSFRGFENLEDLAATFRLLYGSKRACADHFLKVEHLTKMLKS